MVDPKRARGWMGVWLFLLLSACCPGKGHTLAVGSEVEASRNDGTTKAGRITELHGKMAHVQFDDGDQGWIPVVELEPPGAPGPEPSDTCGFAMGDRVKAPWSMTGKVYAGRVTEVHGKLATVVFDDGDSVWVACSELKAHGATSAP